MKKANLTFLPTLEVHCQGLYLIKENQGNELGLTEFFMSRINFLQIWQGLLLAIINL